MSPGGFTPQGGALSDRDETVVQRRGHIGLSTVGRGNCGGVPGGGGDIHPLLPKHYIPRYRNLPYIGDIYGGGAATESAGGQDMVRSGRIGLIGSLGGGKGGGGGVADGKVGIWIQYKGLRRRGYLCRNNCYRDGA